MGSLSTAVFADENAADTSEIAAAETTEDTEEDLAGDSVEESVDADLTEPADTADPEAENDLDEEEETAEEMPASEEEPGPQESEEEPEEIPEISENNTADDFGQETAGSGEEPAVPEEEAEDPQMIPQDSEQVELEHPPVTELEDHLDPVYSDGVKAGMGAARRGAASDVVDLSSLTILPTDVSTPSSGCVLLGLHGKYISQVDAALERINEIRLEACREGVINPTNSQPLTEADYVPIKWSRQLEYIARIRAAEAALTVQHLRTNGGDCFSIQSEDGTSSYGEVLAWNWTDTMTEGIEQWYEEKTDWVNNTAGAVTGHYTQMIDPTHLYIGLGTFCSDSAPYYNSTAGEFSFEDGLDESSMDMEGECIQTLEVNSSYLSGTAAISGASEGTAGESSDHILTIGTAYPKSSRTYTSSGLIFLNNVSWSSSDTAVASVSGGTVTAKKCGETVISASNSNSGKSAELTFTVNHTEKTLPAKKPTCTESGLTEGTQCSACGEILKVQEVIDPTGHTIVVDKAVAATCTKDGLTEGSHCSVCEAVLKAQSEIPATGHAWDSGVVTKEPTCTTSGTRTYTCGNDKSHTRTETINALGHKTVTDPAVPATCTETGLTEGSHCSTCGEVLKAQTVIKATGHAWDSGVVTKEPTCTTSGTRTYTCGNDKSHTKTETINALGHKTVTDPAVPATCTETGLTEGFHCSTCGEILKAQTVIKATGHAWDEGAVTKEPACTEDGTRTYTCGNDKTHTKTEKINATGHTIVTDKAVAATCTKDGLTEGSHCSVCGEILKAQTVIKATGHTSVTDQAVAATCTESGLTEGSHCSVCKAVLKAQEVIPATGHAWDSGAVTKEPTCTESGTRTYTCSNDKRHTRSETINALGHTSVTDQGKAATCTESGLTEGSHCSVCGQTLKVQEAIPAKGHTFGDWKVVTAPTYESEGLRERTCTECGMVEQETMSVLPRTLASASVDAIPARTYTGTAFTPAPTVKMGSTTLKLNTDYTVTYSNNKNAGTATVTITGKGNYTGTKTTTFKINKAAQNIAIKVSAASIAVGKTATVSITGAVGAKTYKSSLAAVAAVNTAGTITAKKVGTTTITATAAATANFNAASKAITIKVVPAATSSITAANQATGIKLTWKSVAGATGYKVYRGSTLVKTIASGSTITCTDTKANANGTKYTFKIVPTAPSGNGLARTLATYRVARPAISSAANSAAKKMTVRWKKNAKANGYQIQYSTNRKFASGNKTVNIIKAATVSRVIGGLAKGKTYYVRIRTYKTVGKAKYWSAWSPAKSVKIKK